MPFDGITVAALCAEIHAETAGGHIAKIIQPEPDELILTVKKKERGTCRLLLSASASLPLACLTSENKTAPLTAPNFCMFLRKYIGGGRITRVSQPGLERVLEFSVEHRNELGDLCSYRLILELMGKHSNLILCDADNVILDAIKHIPSHISSVREVLPGREYFLPQTVKKEDPLRLEKELFTETILGKPLPVAKAVYTSLTGLSPVMAEELCCRAGVDGGLPTDALSASDRARIFDELVSAMDDVKNCRFSPTVYFGERGAKEFAALPLQIFRDLRPQTYSGISEAVAAYCFAREKANRMRQRSADLRQITSTLLERSVKKLDLQEKQMLDTKKRDRYRIFGELINTYGYSLSGGEKELTCMNHYDGREITIPLDPQISAKENAARYFARYGKLKRTAEQLEEHIAQTRRDTEHLESILSSLEMAESEGDLAQIRRELSEHGFLRARGAGGKKRASESARPLHYLSSEGFDMYVGKNNYQNEEVTFRIAEGGDWWFHAKGIPGSHVVVRTGGRELPDSVFEEAGRLAAFYSKGRLAPKVEIDYTLRKNLKKTAGGPPGFVIYHTNYSLMAAPEISGIRQIKE